MYHLYVKREYSTLHVSSVHAPTAERWQNGKKQKLKLVKNKCITGGAAHEGGPVPGTSSRSGGGEQPEADDQRRGEGGGEKTARRQVCVLTDPPLAINRTHLPTYLPTQAS